MDIKKITKGSDVGTSNIMLCIKRVIHPPKIPRSTDLAPVDWPHRWPWCSSPFQSNPTPPGGGGFCDRSSMRAGGEGQGVSVDALFSTFAIVHAAAGAADDAQQVTLKA